MLTYPLDLVRTRMAWSSGLATPSTAALSTLSLPSVAAAQRPPTIRSELVKTFKDGGVSGLYRGMSPTLMGILPYAGLK